MASESPDGTTDSSATTKDSSPPSPGTSTISDRLFTMSSPTSGFLRLNTSKWDPTAKTPLLRVAGFGINLGFCNIVNESCVSDKKVGVAIVISEAPLNAVRGSRLGLSYRENEKSSFKFIEFSDSTWRSPRVIGKVREDKPVNVSCEIRVQALDIPDSSSAYNFFEPSPELRHLWDVKLMVEGVCFHVSKTALAIHSEFFNTLFFGDDARKERTEFELSDIAVIDFVTFLYMLYPPRMKLSASNAEAVLSTADRFMVWHLVDEAQEFLIAQHRLEPNRLPSKRFAEKVRFAERFRLTKFMEILVDSADADNLRDICTNESVMGELSVETSKLLFKKSSALLKMPVKTPKAKNKDLKK